jgi:hypothetical protein
MQSRLREYPDIVNMFDLEFLNMELYPRIGLV